MQWQPGMTTCVPILLPSVCSAVWLSGRLFVLVMMLVGVVLIPVRAGQLYSRLSERWVAGRSSGS